MGISKIKPLTSQYHSVGGSRGRGLLCLAPQLVIAVFNSSAALTGRAIGRKQSNLVRREMPDTGRTPDGRTHGDFIFSRML